MIKEGGGGVSMSKGWALGTGNCEGGIVVVFDFSFDLFCSVLGDLYPFLIQAV